MRILARPFIQIRFSIERVILTLLIVLADIQPGNIMVQVPDQSLIAGYLENTKVNTTAPRQFYFPEGFNMMKLNIALSDLGVASCDR
jgi:hypothetical protein